MSNKMADIMLHIDENTTHEEREKLRDYFLERNGVLTADYKDTAPHLMIVGFDPDGISSSELLSSAKQLGYHAELVTML
ncbi:MAG: ATP-binding protein [Gammaproteobacteria bacterium]|nr:ATP-binding protein [Gammaproteobacteria bacterium]